MAKLTVQTPSQQAVANATQEYEVVDSLGRKLVIRKPGLLAQFRLTEAAGPEAAMNDRYMSMALPLIYVASIDGDIVPMPANKKQLDALINRIEVAGLDAIAACLQEHFANKSTPEEDKAALKK